MYALTTRLESELVPTLAILKGDSAVIAAAIFYENYSFVNPSHIDIGISILK